MRSDINDVIYVMKGKIPSLFGVLVAFDEQMERITKELIGFKVGGERCSDVAKKNNKGTNNKHLSVGFADDLIRRKTKLKGNRRSM